jgi:integrase
MTKFELNQVDVKGDGRVILYQRPRSDGTIIPTWQMRISVPNSTGYHRQSTGEKEQPEATRKALNKYEELAIKVLSGGALNAKNFKVAYDQWKVELPKLVHNKTEEYIDARMSMVGAFPLTFFGPKKLDSIKKSDFTDYWIWRRENSTKTNPATKKTVSYVPSDNSLRREAVHLKAFFSYCVDKGWLQTIPELNQPSLDKTRRPSFNLNEYRLLIRRMREWVKEGQSKGEHARNRFLTQQYVLLLTNCGARVGEFRFVKWMDFSTVQTDDGSRLVANVTGKTGSRQIVFQKDAENYLKRIYDMRKRELNDDPPLDGFVFCHKDGKHIGSFRKGFEGLLEYTGLRQSEDGRNRTLYSLRHFYATMRLSEEVSPYLLAQQMGTSIEMLERFYGHIVTTLIARQLTKVTPKGQRNPNDINDYPFVSH